MPGRSVGMRIGAIPSARKERCACLAGRCRLLKFDGVQELLLLIPLGQNWVMPAQSQQVLSGRLGWALISLESDNELEPAVREFNHWQGTLSAQALAKREIAELEQWRVKPAVRFASEEERHLWRQSEVMLRIAQSREPNRPDRKSNGLIVASLPDGGVVHAMGARHGVCGSCARAYGPSGRSACRAAGLFQRSAYGENACGDAGRRLPDLRRPLLR